MNLKRSTDDVLMTDKEVAAYLRLSDENGHITIRRMAARGDLRAGRGPGGKYLFRKQDVDNIIFSKK